VACSGTALALLLTEDAVVIGGVMVIVIAVGPKVRAFKPSRQRRIFKGTTSFRGEVQQLAPCRKNLRHVSDPLRYDRRY
jgi:hypothetical protein